MVKAIMLKQIIQMKGYFQQISRFGFMQFEIIRNFALIKNISEVYINNRI